MHDEDFGPIPVSRLKVDAAAIFDALRSGRRVLVSRRGEVVAAMDPWQAIAPRWRFDYGTPEQQLETITATDLNQDASHAVSAVQQGSPRYLTRGGLLYGILRELTREELATELPSVAALVREQQLVDDYLESHPHATAEDVVELMEPRPPPTPDAADSAPRRWAPAEARPTPPSRPGGAAATGEEDIEAPLRVLVVDDRPVLHQRLRATLIEQSWVHDVLEARTVEAALRTAETEQPDLIVMDDRLLPDGSGLDATRRILHSVPEARVLILTMEAGPELAAEALAAGVHGLLPQDSDIPELVFMLHAAARPAAGALPAPLDRLTARELEILREVTRRTPTNRIAHKFQLSEKTVRNQLSTIYSKLEVPDRAAATLLAQRVGLTA